LIDTWACSAWNIIARPDYFFVLEKNIVSVYGIKYPTGIRKAAVNYFT